MARITVNCTSQLEALTLALLIADVPSCDMTIYSLGRCTRHNYRLWVPLPVVTTYTNVPLLSSNIIWYWLAVVTRCLASNQRCITDQWYIHLWADSLVHTSCVHVPWIRVSKMTTVFTACAHGPWTRESKNDSRVHGPCWSSVYLTQAVNTGVIFWHPSSQAVSTVREDGCHFGPLCAWAVHTACGHG